MTDPAAVMDVHKTAVADENLFNDDAGVVIFTTILGGQALFFFHALQMFAREKAAVAT